MHPAPQNRNTTVEDGFDDQLYITVREKEGRVYADKELTGLPVIPASHRHRNEWIVRQHSYSLLAEYFSVTRKCLKIMDRGCGNGWMSNALSLAGDHQVLGVDLNKIELEQANRVFSANANVRFVYADIFKEDMENDFDVIVIASAIQYFESLEKLVKRLFSFLRPGGEIHIIDSPIYRKSDIAAARSKTLAYYTAIGFPEMANWYYHHSFDDLQFFNYRRNKEGVSFLERFFSAKKSPFPWIIIHNK